MKINSKGRLDINRREFKFPNLLDEGKKYGLSEIQIKQLSRYLDDKRLLRLISLESFNRSARAWLSALTGIVADVLAIDAHVSIWMNKRLEKPRNWIISKLSNFIPTKIDDMAFKAVQIAQNIMDNKILPLKEDIMTKISNSMHNKYDYNNEYTYLGNSLKDLKSIAKANLKDSKAVADSDAMKVLKQRKYQAATLGGYHDEAGNFINLRKYQSTADKMFAKLTNKEERYGTKGKGKGNEKGKDISKAVSQREEQEVP